MAGENNGKKPKNDGINTMVISLVIALVMFMLGYLSSSQKSKEETIKFTYEEIQMIETFQKQLQTQIGKNAEIIVYKTKGGEMLFSWE